MFFSFEATKLQGCGFYEMLLKINICSISKNSLLLFVRTLLKRGSRHAAHAAKALRWRVKQLLKCLNEKESLVQILCFMSSSANR